MYIQFMALTQDGETVQDEIMVDTTSEDKNRQLKCQEAIKVKYPNSTMIGWSEIIK